MSAERQCSKIGFDCYGSRCSATSGSTRRGAYGYGGAMRAGLAGMLVIVLVGCGSSSEAPPEARHMSAGCEHRGSIAPTTGGTIRSGGISRPYNLRVPASDDPVPLVVNLHGALANADAQDKMSGWPALANQEGVALLTPGADATRRGFWWLSPDGSEPAVAYLRQLIGQVQGDVCVDLDRVYLTGFSQGAMLSLILACAEPGRFAAVAVVAGITDIQCADRSTPVIAFHGTSDEIVGFDGRMAPNVAGLVGYRVGPSVPELASEWQAKLATHSGGHEWPEDTTREAWDFFEDHSLAEKAGQ